jgi:hypothetical protein
MADNIPEYVAGWVDSGDKWQIRYDSPGKNEEHLGRIVKGGGDNLSIPEAWWLTPVSIERMASSYYGFRCARDVRQMSSAGKTATGSDLSPALRNEEGVDKTVERKENNDANSVKADSGVSK